MAEPSLERLNQFTPDAGRLDRDALLFAAGRSSARPSRRWTTLAATLAVTQSLSLILLWPPRDPAVGGSTLPVAGPMDSKTTVAPRIALPSSRPISWSDRHRLRDATTDDDADWVESGPPLRAFPLPPSLLN